MKSFVEEKLAPIAPMTFPAWLDLAVRFGSVVLAFWFMGYVRPALIPTFVLGDGFGVLVGISTVIGLPVYAVSAYLDTLYSFPRSVTRGIASLVMVIAPVIFPALLFQESLTRSELLLVGGIQLYLVYGCVGLWFTWRHREASPVLRMLTGHVPPRLCSVMLGVSMLCFLLGVIPVVMKGVSGGMLQYTVLGAWFVVIGFSIAQRIHSFSKMYDERHH